MTPKDPEHPGYAPGPGDPCDAAYLRERVRLKPGDWRRWMQLALRLKIVGPAGEALSAFRETVRLAPWNGLPHLMLACRLGGTASAKWEAMTAARRATELRPNDADAWSCLGHLHSREDPEAALQCYLRAVRLDDDYEIYWVIGCCLCRLGRHREAVVALEETVRRKPNHLPALHLLYRYAKDVGEFDVARERLRALFTHNRVRAWEFMEWDRKPPRAGD
jgi:cytochrome c-type biogenesis protein CcmH/NrfG